MARRFSRPEALASIHEVRARIFESMGDYRRAYLAQDTFLALSRELLNEGRVKAVAEMNERYESERKARQIQQLELEKLDVTLTNARITSARNSYLFSGLFAMLLALGLYTRLRFVRRSRAALQHQKDVSDSLLRNILPASVAEELKERGTAIARHYDSATILFSDFEDFTAISSGLTPDELVEEVNSYFKAFDAIIAHYRLEKIKTIGDAYMAAAGIEGISNASAIAAVSAGLAMQAYVERRNDLQRQRGYPLFGMRLGIHSGPVVAGIVGASKFQYDLWGDTVNTASRMESLGETGRVNISEVTYRLVRDHPGFSFTPRGPMEVKGKGSMPLYFAELAFPDKEMDDLVRKA
jgi:class 3 adenylate cyclase